MTRFEEVLSRVSLPHGWVLLVRKDGNRDYLQIEDRAAACNVTGAPLPWRGRKWFLSPHMTDGEIVQTAFAATMAAVEHETRETFTYRGHAIFDPHYDIERLVELRAQPNALIEREKAA